MVADSLHLGLCCGLERLRHWSFCIDLLLIVNFLDISFCQTFSLVAGLGLHSLSLDLHDLCILFFLGNQKLLLSKIDNSFGLRFLYLLLGSFSILLAGSMGSEDFAIYCLLLLDFNSVDYVDWHCVD